MPESVVPYGQVLPEIPGRLAWEEPKSHLVRDGGGYRIEHGRRPSKTLLANRLREGRLTIAAAREAKVATHLLAYGSGTGNGIANGGDPCGIPASPRNGNQRTAK